MSGITHVAVGGAIGFAVGNPYLGFLGGLLSHIVLDRIPHQEFFGLGGELFSSSLLFAAVMALAPANMLAVAAGVSGSCLPDLEIVLWLEGKLSKDQLIFPTHNHILPQRHSKSLIMALLQLLFILIGLAIVSQ